MYLEVMWALACPDISPFTHVPGSLYFPQSRFFTLPFSDAGLASRSDHPEESGGIRFSQYFNAVAAYGNDEICCTAHAVGRSVGWLFGFVMLGTIRVAPQRASPASKVQPDTHSHR